MQVLQVNNGPSAEVEEEEEEAAFRNQVLLAKGGFDIVGIRYYRGVAHPGEYVYLVREPRNPYDRNAIRVDNVHHEKIGHIKREQAALLSPLMDSHHGSILHLEGIIPRPGNAFSLPLCLEFYATTNDPTQALKLSQVLRKRMRFYRNVRMERESSGDAAVRGADGPSPTEAATPVVQTQKLDWTQQQQQLVRLSLFFLPSHCQNDHQQKFDRAQTSGSRTIF